MVRSDVVRRHRLTTAVLAALLAAIVLAVPASAAAPGQRLADSIFRQSSPSDRPYLVGVRLLGGRATIVDANVVARGVTVELQTTVRNRTQYVRGMAVRLCYYATRALAADPALRATVSRIIVIGVTRSGVAPFLAQLRRGACVAASGSIATTL